MYVHCIRRDVLTGGEYTIMADLKIRQRRLCDAGNYAGDGQDVAIARS